MHAMNQQVRAGTTNSLVTIFIFIRMVSLSFQDQTALHHAIQSESFETILVLLQYGAAVDLNDHQGRTPACFFHRPHKYLPCLSL